MDVQTIFKLGQKTAQDLFESEFGENFDRRMLNYYAPAPTKIDFILNVIKQGEKVIGQFIRVEKPTRPILPINENGTGNVYLKFCYGVFDGDFEGKRYKFWEQEHKKILSQLDSAESSILHEWFDAGCTIQQDTKPEKKGYFVLHVNGRSVVLKFANAWIQYVDNSDKILGPEIVGLCGHVGKERLTPSSLFGTGQKLFSYETKSPLIYNKYKLTSYEDLCIRSEFLKISKNSLRINRDMSLCYIDYCGLGVNIFDLEDTDIDNINKINPINILPYKNGADLSGVAVANFELFFLKGGNGRINISNTILNNINALYKNVKQFRTKTKLPNHIKWYNLKFLLGDQNGGAGTKSSDICHLLFESVYNCAQINQRIIFEINNSIRSALCNKEKLSALNKTHVLFILNYYFVHKGVCMEENQYYHLGKLVEKCEKIQKTVEGGRYKDRSVVFQHLKLINQPKFLFVSLMEKMAPYWGGGTIPDDIKDIINKINPQGFSNRVTNDDICSFYAGYVSNERTES